jgi:hypothetical protein
VDIAAARVQAMAAGESLPTGLLALAEVGLGVVIKIVLGAFATGAGLALVGLIWREIQKRKQEKAWRRDYTPQYPRIQQPRAPSEMEILKLGLFNQMANSRPQLPYPPLKISKVGDDEEDIGF